MSTEAKDLNDATPLCRPKSDDQNVPLEYKRTEVGLIPEEWMSEPLGNLFTFKNGLNKAKRFFGVGTPIVNYMDVFAYPGLRSAKIQGRVSLTAEEIKTFEVRRGDVFFTRTSETLDEIGMTSVMLDDSPNTVFSGFVLRARPIDSRLDDAYKQYCFSVNAVRRQIVSAGTYTTRALTNGRSLSAVYIALPPLPEQRAIGVALSDVDALLDELDRLIAKKRHFKQATMKQLLSGQTRLPGYHGEWAVKRIREFASCTAGGTPSTLVPQNWGGSIRWMNSGDLHLKQVHDVEGRITDNGLKNSSAKMLPAGSVLIGLAGQGKTRGTVATNRVPLCTNQSIAAILPNSTFASEYLYHNLDSRYDELRDLSSGGGGRGGLNLTIIRSIAIPFPSISEQCAIATVLSDMDAEIVALEARLNKTRDFKKAMMQELLTGKTRLVEPEVANA